MKLINEITNMRDYWIQRRTLAEIMGLDSESETFVHLHDLVCYVRPTSQLSGSVQIKNHCEAVIDPKNRGWF